MLEPVWPLLMHMPTAPVLCSQEHVEKALEPLTKHLKVLTDEVRAGRSVPESRPLSEWLVSPPAAERDLRQQ